MLAVKQSFIVVLATAAALGAACGGSSGGTGSGARDVGTPSSAAGSCTGAVPPNATMCPGSGSGLTSDAPRVVTGSSCPAGTPCSYFCNTGFVVSNGACVNAPSAPPAVQFTDNGNGTVTSAGGLTWLRDANCTDDVMVGALTVVGGAVSWDDASAWTGGLADGACGLRDGSVHGDWRLPSQGELMHLALGLSLAHPFLHVQSGNYWSSFSYLVDQAGAVDLRTGDYFQYPKTSQFHVWPVR